MKLGDQTAPTNDTHLKYLARYGVRNICGYPRDRRRPPLRHRRRAQAHDRHGREIRHQHRLHRRRPSSHPATSTTKSIPAIMLAQSPERDRDIEQLQTFIRNCAQAGIPSIKYNMSILGVLRTGRMPGRGDAMYTPVEALRGASRNAAHQAPASSTPTPSGSASRTFSTASFRWPTNTKSAWPAIRRIPAFRPKATRA